MARELAAHLRTGRYPLRAAIARFSGRDAVIESTCVELDARDPYRERFTEVELTAPRRKDHQDGKFAVVQVVPTGVRCEIGGFAGDACPATNLLASAADVVITHPNAVNASDINEMAANVLSGSNRLRGRLRIRSDSWPTRLPTPGMRT